MSLKLVLALAAASGLLGVGLGAYLRFLISLGKKGSMELRLKQMEFAAQEESKKTLLRAQEEAAHLLKEARTEAKEREDALKKSEERLVKR